MADGGLDGDDLKLSEIFTKFLLGTYRLQPTRHDILAVLINIQYASQHPDDNPEDDIIPLLSGSSAELYIKPMLQCVDDVDIMYHRSTHLAIPAGYSAPTELPAEFRSRVEVYGIIDTDFPGYVYLKTRYIMTESNDDCRYNVVLDNSELFVMNTNKVTNAEQHGPAVTLTGNSVSPALDSVRCVRCLAWPTQAADWPTRHRNYDWPDSATVGRVVSNGCDMVQVSHRLCRHDEWETKYQWRLSFSRAELVLLNSWTPAQQLMYHILRLFIKASGLRDIANSTGTKIINNYHIKTLILWVCEQNPRCWWTENTNLVRICVELLHTLGLWSINARCTHYFINNCNLMDHAINVENIAERLLSVTESWLSTWFIDRYVLKCAQLCPDNVSRLFDDVSSSVKLQTAVLAVVAWRRETALVDLWDVYDRAEYLISASATDWCKSIQSHRYMMRTFSKYNVQCSYCINAIGFLQSAIQFAKHNLNVDTMDILSIFCGQSISRRRYSSQPGSVLLLNQAAKLMKVVANNSRSTVQLIEIELSKAYLYRALRCKDSDSDSIYCLANLYLVVLYYNTGPHQALIDHCTLVTRSPDHSQCSSHVVQGELLPKIDGNVDNALGLAVFYQYLRRAVFNQQQQTQHIGVFTTELLANYMLIKCMSSGKYQAYPCNDVRLSYRQNVATRHEQHTADILLYKVLCIYFSKTQLSLCKSLLYQRQSSTVSLTGLNTSELVELLQQSAVGHLTTYRQFQAREFGSVATIVTTDFEAMYAYKCGDYQLCLQLSTQNVHTLLYAQRIPYINIFPEFILLLDDNIVSLTALTLIFNPGCRGASANVGISQLALSLYLMTRCQLKLRHSATQLAQSLEYMNDAQRKQPVRATLNRLVLKLTRRKAMIRLKESLIPLMNLL